MNLIEQIGEPAALELLAEECTELAQAALKLARIERGENPTPVNKCAAMYSMMEEMADVAVTYSQIEMHAHWVNEKIINGLANQKESRMEARILGKET